MPRRAKPFTVYPRPGYSPWFWVRFADGHREPLNGFPADESKRRAAEEEACARVAKRASKRLTPEIADRIPLERATELYLEHVDATYTGTDVRHGGRITTDLYEYVEGRWPRVSAITTESWEKAKMELHRSKRLGWRSIAHLANTLRGFLRWAQSQNMIAVVPEIASPPTKEQKAERKPRTALSAEQREKFLTALQELKELRAHRIYTVLFETWQRKRTIEAMTPRWLDSKAETIRIPARFIKGRKELVIDLTPRCSEAIKAELATRQVVEADKPIFGKFDFHWTNKKEHPGKGVFERACSKAGIDLHGLTPHHSTRHSALTIAGSDPEATLSGLMAQSGASAQVLEEHYLHPRLEDARRVTRKRS